MISVFGNCLLPLEFGVLEKVFLLLILCSKMWAGTPLGGDCILCLRCQISPSILFYFFFGDGFSE